MTATVDHLIRAIESAHLHQVLRILLTNPETVKHRDMGDSWTPLHHSVKLCSRLSCQPAAIDILNNILASQFAVEAALVQSRQRLLTPLHLACRLLVTNQVLAALAQCNPAALASPDLDGETPLHTALRYKHSDASIHFLVELAFAHHGQDKAGSTLLQYKSTLIRNPLEMADYMDGNLPLHVAVSHEASASTVQLLLDAYPLAISTMNSYGHTPLHLACFCARHDLVSIFLTNHAATGIILPLLRAKDHLGYQPLDLLYYSHSQAYITMDDLTSDESIDSWDSLTCMALAIRLASSSSSVVSNRIHQSFLDQVDDIYLLIQASLPLGLDIAPVPFIQLLIQEHPHVLTKTNAWGQTLLHLAYRGNEESTAINPFPLYCYCHFQQPLLTQHDEKDCTTTEKLSTSSSCCETCPCSCKPLLKMILMACPEAASVPDVYGSLPLHYASQSYGTSWEHHNIQDLILAYPEALSVPCPSSNMYPFMIAASAHNLELSYHLLRNAPHQISLHNNMLELLNMDTSPMSPVTIPASEPWADEASYDATELSRRSTLSPTTVTFDVFASPCMLQRKKVQLATRKRRKIFVSPSV
jgi:ankyrin repeat protein